MRCRCLAVILTLLVGLSSALADEKLKSLLGGRIVSQERALQQHLKYVEANIAALKLAPTAEAWQKQARSLRRRVVEEVVFRGVPASWRKRNPAIRWQDTIEEDDYRIRKLTVEALPGLWIPALLYEPRKLSGKVPVVLNVNGHDRKGKASPYKQIRCINQAKRGMIALNIEWLGMGQLRTPDYSHNHLAKLDLCGRSGLSVFFLSMSRGLDVLLQHKHADPKRVAVTGLSGGGWQTIILSSLDERVTLSVPVAGYSALGQRLTHRGSIGDLEQVPNDLVGIADYAHLTAMMVPRPTLLIYNDKDNCCFVSKTVKPNTFDPIVPFFAQAGVKDRFEYYENSDPGDHNYGRDNRQQLYRFLGRHFFPGNSNYSAREIDVAKQVKSPEELLVRLPEANANFHTLARRAASSLPAKKNSTRARLREVLRWTDAEVTSSQQVGKAGNYGDALITRHSIRIDKHWELPAVIIAPLKPTGTTLVLCDRGRHAAVGLIAEEMKRKRRVICVDIPFVGEVQPARSLYQYVQMISSVGKRPLGIQASHVAAASAYYRRRFASSVQIKSLGPRTSLAALCAVAATKSRHVTEVSTAELPVSLKKFLEPDATYGATPEIYCFGLLQDFDIQQLRALAK